MPRMAKGSSEGGKREAKGAPKGTTGIQRMPKGPKEHPKGAQGFPKESKGHQSRPKGGQRRSKEAKGKRYIPTNSRSTAQADVMLTSCL